MKLTIALEESIYVLLCVKHGFKNGWRDISKEELSANMYCIREINLTAISPQISSSTFCYVRLVLVNVLLVHTLTVWRVKREEKKADVILSK